MAYILVSREVIIQVQRDTDQSLCKYDVFVMVNVSGPIDHHDLPCLADFPVACSQYNRGTHVESTPTQGRTKRL